MTQIEKVAKNLQRFRIGVASHDRENPDHPPAYGVGLTRFDLDCLGFEEGEELWSGIKVYVVENVTTGNFRVLCNAETGPPKKIVAEVGDKVHA